MPDIVFSNRSVPVPAGGCSFAGVTCMGGGKMLAIFYNSLQEHWVYVSEDNGQTWDTVLEQHESANNIWFWAAIATGTDTVLVGNEGPMDTPPGTDDVIARTTDGGLTWGKAVDDSLFPDGSDFWDTLNFVRLDNDEFWALGGYNIDGTDYHYLVSTDGGASFADPVTLPAPSAGSITGALCGAYCGDDVVVLGMQMFGAGAKPRVYRTTDRGASWTEIVLDDSQYSHATNAGSVRGIAYLGNDTLIATGTQAMGVGNFPPKTWRSTDAGATWTEITDSLPDWTAAANHAGRDVVSLGNGVAVLAMSGRPDRVGDSHWRYTTDYGATWAKATAGGYTEADTVTVAIDYMAVADDGTIVVTLQSGPNNDEREIWIGELDGITGSGPCVDFDEETVGTLTVPSGLECVPSFVPPLCPPECPPAATITYTTPASVATQAGYASFLPVLGLMLGGITVAATVPAGCGPAFTSEPCDRVEIT